MGQLEVSLYVLGPVDAEYAPIRLYKPIGRLYVLGLADAKCAIFRPNRYIGSMVICFRADGC